MNKQAAPVRDDAPAASGREGAGRAAARRAPQAKQMVTMRLDADTLAWLKASGPGYQTRINQILRAHMQVGDDDALA